MGALRGNWRGAAAEKRGESGATGGSFGEAACDEGFELSHDGFSVCAFGADFDFCPAASGEHHEAHDAFPVDLFVIFFDPDLGFEGTGRLDEHGGGARMEAELVDDGEFFGEHGRDGLQLIRFSAITFKRFLLNSMAL